MSRLHIWLPGLIALLVLTGCGGATEPNATSLPTPTLFPTYLYTGLTEPAPVQTAAALTATARTGGQTLDRERVQRGKERYEALECGKCHGANGEGTADGSALVGLTLGEGEFISFLRSGGSIGSEHQYSTNRLSESGGRNLYQYLLSLGS